MTMAILNDISDNFMITPSDVIEYLFCPRFSYYEKVLGIPQNEKRRLKVRLGRDIHEQKQKTLGSYLRKRLKVIDKQSEIPLYSRKWHLSAKVDEALFLEDGRISPLDYKFAEWKGHVHRPLYYQSIIYGILLEEQFDRPSERGFIVYTRTKNHIEQIDFPEERHQMIAKAVYGIFSIIDSQILPEEHGSKSQCGDCTYWRVCEQGLS